MTVQSKNNKLSYLIDLTLTKGNRLFVSSFERIEENNVKKIIDILFQVISAKRCKSHHQRWFLKMVSGTS